jgi:hypothetical protein
VNLTENQAIIENKGTGGSNPNSSGNLNNFGDKNSSTSLLQDSSNLQSQIGTHVKSSVTSVINGAGSSSSKGFAFNYLLLGLVVLILSGYLYVSRRKA